MIVSASRRTDIPAFYADWLVNRLQAGYVLVRNPMRTHQVSKIMLSPQQVRFIVFWSKNPAPLMSRLEAFRDYEYGFQYTLTGYGASYERGVPDWREGVKTFQELSDRIGPDKMVWRYDPVLMAKDWDVEAHLMNYERLAVALKGYTARCVISWLDLYSQGKARMKQAGVRTPLETEISLLAPGFSEVAARNGMRVEACAETGDLSRYGILPGHCIDPRLTGVLSSGKDKGQRPSCGCQPAVDIGAYHSCAHRCVYCYANGGDSRLMKHLVAHDPLSPFLVGNSAPGDVIRDRIR